MDVGSVPAAAEERWMAVLDGAERARAGRFHFAADRTAYVAAHALIRTLLARVGGLAPAELRFVVGEHGKPEIDPAVASDLSFNLSHTRGFVAGALSRGSPVGIDVEARDRVVAGASIAGRYFAPTEVAFLEAAPEAARRLMFLRFWTLKEAYLKATGTGINRPLASFSFSLDPIRVAFAADVADAPEQWQFLQRFPTAGHILAVALRCPASSPVALTLEERTFADI